VAGNAAGVFEEVEEAKAILENPVIFAANDVGIYLKHVDHWCSLHTNNLAAWKAARWLSCDSVDRTYYHGVDEKPFIDYAWGTMGPLLCLSGYFAMQVAWVMGCDRIVLAGCPGDGTKRFFEARPRPDYAYGSGADGREDGIRQSLLHEMKRLPDFREAVRSMSGWTKTVFGGL
jgi:hypothetical protein